jgi:hypothetical protein
MVSDWNCLSIIWKRVVSGLCSGWISIRTCRKVFPVFGSLWSSRRLVEISLVIAEASHAFKADCLGQA